MSNTVVKECPNCGTEIIAGARFCEFCGAKIAPQNTVAPITAQNSEPFNATLKTKEVVIPQVKEVVIPKKFNVPTPHTIEPHLYTYGEMPRINDDFTYGRIFNEELSQDNLQDESPIKLTCDIPISMRKDVSSSYSVKFAVTKGTFSSVKVRMFLADKVVSEVSEDDCFVEGTQKLLKFCCSPTTSGKIPLYYELECLYEGTNLPEIYKSHPFEVTVYGIQTQSIQNPTIIIDAKYNADKAGDIGGGNINIGGLENKFGQSENAIFKQIQLRENVHIPLEAVKVSDAITFLLNNGSRLHIFTKEEVVFGRCHNDVNLLVFNMDGTINPKYSRAISRKHFSIKNIKGNFSIKNESSTHNTLLSGRPIGESSSIAKGRSMDLSLCPPPATNYLGLTIDTTPTNDCFCKQCAHKCIFPSTQPSSVVVRRHDNIPEVYAIINTCLDLGTLFPNELSGYLLTRTGNKLQLISPRKESSTIVLGAELAQGTIRVLPLTQVK